MIDPLVYWYFVIDWQILLCYSLRTDIEDANALFDNEQVKKELAFEAVKQFDDAVAAYTQSGREYSDTAFSEIRLFALQETVASLIVRHNRILWKAVQRLWSGKQDDSPE